MMDRLMLLPLSLGWAAAATPLEQLQNAAGPAALIEVNRVEPRAVEPAEPASPLPPASFAVFERMDPAARDKHLHIPGAFNDDYPVSSGDREIGRAAKTFTPRGFYGGGYDTLTFKDENGNTAIAGLATVYRQTAYSSYYKVEVKDGRGRGLGSIRQKAKAGSMTVWDAYEIQDAAGKILATEEKGVITAPSGKRCGSLVRSKSLTRARLPSWDVKDLTKDVDPRLILMLAAFRASRADWNPDSD